MTASILVGSAGGHATTFAQVTLRLSPATAHLWFSLRFLWVPAGAGAWDWLCGRRGWCWRHSAFSKMLLIPDARVMGVEFTPAAIVVDLKRRSRRLCCPCGWSTRATYDRSVRTTWRHLDLGAAGLVLRGQVRQLACQRCDRVRTEKVPLARPGLGSPGTSRTCWPGWLNGWARPRWPSCCTAPGRP